MSCARAGGRGAHVGERGLEIGDHHGGIAHGAAAAWPTIFSMFCMVFENAVMFSSDSTREARSTTSVARPTRSGRLARNRSKFDCTESMTGYCSLGTGSMPALRVRVRQQVDVQQAGHALQRQRGQRVLGDRRLRIDVGDDLHAIRGALVDADGDHAARPRRRGSARCCRDSAPRRCPGNRSRSARSRARRALPAYQ